MSEKKKKSVRQGPSFREIVNEIILTQWDFNKKQRKQNKVSLAALKKELVEKFGRDTNLDLVHLKQTLKKGVERGWLEKIDQSYTLSSKALTALDIRESAHGKITYNTYVFQHAEV